MQPLTRILQASPTFFNTPPSLKHPRAPHQPYQSCPQADHTPLDAPQHSQRVHGNATPGYTRLSNQ
jgi:hypothetical protein